MDEATDQKFMRMALELAERARGATSPNPLVGAVVVQGETVVGQGFHAAAGKAHAEVNAIADAGAAAEGATLYVTLEPCNHFGRTPPCTHRILEAGLQRVVIALSDPNPDVTGGGAAYLAENGVAVDLGVCTREAARQNDWFIKYIRTKQPFVIAKCASTLDGRIAASSGDARWVTGKAARGFVHRLRHSVDAIMVGRQTVEQDDPSLTTRLPDGGGSDPTRIVLDSSLGISTRAKVVTLSSSSPTWVVCGPEADPERIKRFEAAGVRILKASLHDGWIDLKSLMGLLGGEGIASLLLEGGSRLMGSAIRSGIVDKVLFFYAPKILAGDDGSPICAGAGGIRMSDAVGVSDVEVHRFGDDVLIEGYLRRPELKSGPRPVDS
jgi:diaminohydroxyphosphoribosylaminopyrimidine deaminase/5-amino-6-(5-phosphoribosylamino)uracil reductase